METFFGGNIADDVVLMEGVGVLRRAVVVNGCGGCFKGREYSGWVN